MEHDALCIRSDTPLSHFTWTVSGHQRVDDTGKVYRVGHKDISTTLNIYTHSLENNDCQAALALEAMLWAEEDPE